MEKKFYERIESSLTKYYCISKITLKNFLQSSLMPFLMMLSIILLPIQMSSGIWSVPTTWNGFPTWTWPTSTCGLGQEVPVDLNAGKTQLVLFDQSNNTGCIDVKKNRSVLEEKSSFKKLGLAFYSKLDSNSYIISIAKSTSTKKIGALIPPMKFLFCGCSASAQICHTIMYGILLSYLGWCS